MRRIPRTVRGLPIAAFVLGWVFGACPVPAEELLLAGGPPGGEYETVGRALETVFQRHAKLSTVRYLPTWGSVENARRLIDGSAAVAIVRADVLWQAFRGEGEFDVPHPELRVLGLLHEAAIHMVARPGATFGGPAGLRGKRVSLGSSENGGALPCWEILRAHGLDPADVVVVRTDEASLAARLESGELDAALLPAAVPHPGLREALHSGSVLLPLEGALQHGATRNIDRVLTAHPYLRRGRISAAAYGRPLEMAALELDYVLATTDRMGRDVARDLSETLFASAQELRRTTPLLQPVGAALTSQRSVLPLHDGLSAHLDTAVTTRYPIKVLVGVYAYSISELDTVSGTFLFDGYVWFRWQGRLFQESDGPFEFAVVNGVIESIDEGARVIRKNGWNRQSRRLTVRLRSNFLLSDYPFDRQRLAMILEHRWQGSEKLVFVPDDLAARGADLRHAFLAEGLEIHDWRIEKVAHRSYTKQYETDFGTIDRDEWQGRSSRYEFSIDVRRTVARYAVKLLLPLLVAVSMGFIVFWIDPQHFDAKICLGILALLNCIGLHIAHAGHLPEAGYVVKADWFFLDAYVMICLCLVQVVYEQSLLLRGREEGARRSARLSRWIFPLVFLAPILWLFATG